MMEQPILFFDGVCNLCNRTVDFLIRQDRLGHLRYASLQGETAHKMVPEFAQEKGLSTVVWVEDGKKHVRSTAIGLALKRIGGIWGVLGSILLFIPKPIRDWGYRWVAKNRIKMYGQRETCRIPTEAERMLFLP